MRRSKLIGAALAALFITSIAHADSTPNWVKPVLQIPVQNFDKSVPFVVLLDERTTTVKENGKTETRSRYVVRVLSQEGRIAARREIPYDSQTKISDLSAWHVRADQKVFELESDKVVETSITDDLYSEIRSKVMRFGEVDVGSVVAFEWVQKEKPLVNQDYYFFQTRSPVVMSRYHLNLPTGWRVESFLFNHDPIKPVINGNSYTWTLENLPAIKEEPWMPETTGLFPYLAVSYFPPRSGAAERTFSSWQDVSRWAERIMNRRIRAEQLVASKAREVTAGLDSELEKVRAISRWVQKNIRYVSIQLGAVGGYRPNLADVVLKKSYGDCKDKCSLMQAMLRSVGIQSHLTLVFSGDPTRVRPEFPSPLQFNHAIVAISVNSGGPGIQEFPRFGRLLFFDPTDNVTPPGDLPFYLQGTYGLVVNGEMGELVRLPIHPQEHNSIRREVIVQIEARGEIAASVKEDLTGQLASVTLRRIASSSAEEYARELSSRVGRDIPGAVVGDLKINRDGDLGDTLSFQYRVRANNYANRMGKLLVIRPVLLWVQNYPVFTKAERQYPILFEMKSIKEDSIKLALPEGFKLDEVPSGIEIIEGFGEFKMTYEVNGREVLVKRRLTITRQLVPASEYDEVKKFFDRAQTASQSSIVLISQ